MHQEREDEGEHRRPVFVLQCGVFVLQCGVFVLQYGVSMLQYGVFVLQYGVCVLQYGVTRGTHDWIRAHEFAWREGG